MPLFTYNRDIPNEPNNPSVDQPKMKINTNSTDDLIDVNHFSFGEANGGLHRQIEMPIRGGGTGTIPPGLVAGEGTLYTKSSSGTQLFYTPDASGNEYQMTRTDSTLFSLFGTNTNYQVGPPSMTGGWIFLPGGLILNYGTALTSLGTQVVTFAKPMTNLFSLTISYKSNSTKYGISTESGTGFTLVTDSGSTGTRFYWMAIGN